MAEDIRLAKGEEVDELRAAVNGKADITSLETEGYLKRKEVSALPYMEQEISFSDDISKFVAQNRITVTVETDADKGKCQKFVTAGNAANAYAFAYLDFTDFATGADKLTLDFDFKIDNSRWFVGLSDISQRPGTSSRAAYDDTGVAFFCGTKDGTYFYVNGTNMRKTTFFNKWVHCNIVVDLEAKTVTYKLTNDSVTDTLTDTVAFNDANIEKVTGLELYSYVNNQTAYVGDISLSAQFGDETDDRTLYMIRNSNGLYTSYENNSEIEPGKSIATISTLEEVFYTSFVEGAQLDMRSAMEFITSGKPPRDIEEQLIANNRQAGSYAAANLYKPIDADVLKTLVYILTDGMDGGGYEYRVSDNTEYISPFDESPVFPSARVVSERVNDLCAFLNMRDVHPLIKASASQAYILALRPFPEGNERLSRIVSSMILVRAGYVFFSDISLSALMAKRSYAYFEAEADILREENGDDLTYFMEYYLELLARAIDERKLRREKIDEQNREYEREMAKNALAPLVQADESAENLKESSNDFFVVARQDNPNNGRPCFSPARIKEILREYAKGHGKVLSKGAATLLRFMNEGTETFTTKDIEQDCGITSRQATKLISDLSRKGLVEHSGGKIGKFVIYRLKMEVPGAEHTDYAPEILRRLKMLRSHKTNKKDRRISKVITSCLDKGVVSASDYMNIGEYGKMPTDMKLAENLGLVRKTAKDTYEICHALNQPIPKLTAEKKADLKTLYNAFESEWFTTIEARKAVGRSKNSVNDLLHRFTLYGILETTGEHTRDYRLIVNPEDNPSLLDHMPKKEITENHNKGGAREYSKEIYDFLNELINTDTRESKRRLGKVILSLLPKGFIQKSDYDKLNYSIYQWGHDISDAQKMGLVTKQGQKYVINTTLKSNPAVLSKNQKKSIAEIYETFGENKFSSSMYIATLNYTPAHTYAKLSKLTLMRVLEQKNTKYGRQYQLRVNPKENPEYFDIAA